MKATAENIMLVMNFTCLFLAFICLTSVLGKKSLSSVRVSAMKYFLSGGLLVTIAYCLYFGATHYSELTASKLFHESLAYNTGLYKYERTNITLAMLGSLSATISAIVFSVLGFKKILEKKSA